MSHNSNNMELWNKVCRTNPDDTQPVKKGSRQFTSICSQSQIKAATEQFGVYGRTWGLRNIRRDFESMKDYEIAIFSAEFFFPDGSFEISTSLPVWISKPKGIIDNDICKKSETDLLTKALSKIGFNADVFMGLFDDNRYVSEMREEFRNSGSQDNRSHQPRKNPQGRRNQSYGNQQVTHQNNHPHGNNGYSQDNQQNAGYAFQHPPANQPQQAKPQGGGGSVPPVITPAQVANLRNAMRMANITEEQFCRTARIQQIGQMTQDRLKNSLGWLQKKASQ